MYPYNPCLRTDLETVLERDAMGDDEYHPISKKGTNLSDTGSIGYTVIDAIDTMLIMGLDNEYQSAKTWIQEKLSFDRNANYNTFEVSIQIGGVSVENLVTTRQRFVRWAVYCPHIICPWESLFSSKKLGSSATESFLSSIHPLVCHFPWSTSIFGKGCKTWPIRAM